MRMVRNAGALPQTLSWCIIPEHWFQLLHLAPQYSFQTDAFDLTGFDATMIEFENTVVIEPGGTLEFDDTQINGIVIRALAALKGMVE